jgi:hypothetical protein
VDVRGRGLYTSRTPRGLEPFVLRQPTSLGLKAHSPASAAVGKRLSPLAGRPVGRPWRTP